MPYNPPATRFHLIPFLKRCTDREPTVMLSAVVAVIGFVFPAVAIPVRNSMGLPTWNYNAESEQNIRIANSLIGTEAKWSGNL